MCSPFWPGCFWSTAKPRRCWILATRRCDSSTRFRQIHTRPLLFGTPANQHKELRLKHLVTSPRIGDATAAHPLPFLFVAVISTTPSSPVAEPQSMFENDTFAQVNGGRFDSSNGSFTSGPGVLGTGRSLPSTGMGHRIVQDPHYAPPILAVLPGGNSARVYRIAKRALDFFGALALLILFSPLMLLSLLALTVTTKGRPIFVQLRLGHCGRPFRMFKFRTMHFDAHQNQHGIANEMDGPVFKNRRDPRITRLGRLLRQFSIDEMPQLINVLKGEMSLVGPRPPIPSEVAKYEPWQQQRLAVKPGLTCLWQVSGRNEIGFEDWVRMDLWYIENQSLLVDLKLLLLTPWTVISRKGAY